MKSYVIVARQSNLIQQNEDRILCIFSTMKDAESYLKLYRSESEVCIVEYEVERWSKEKLGKPEHRGMKVDTVIIDDVY